MYYLKRLVALLLHLFCFLPLQGTFAQTKIPTSLGGRSTINLAQNWKFIRDPANQTSLPKPGLGWKNVNLPHTWNDQDVMDNVPGYYRGAGWYKKVLKTNKNWRNKQVYLCFDGSNQETEVFVNGKKAGRHAGGYTRFIMPVTAFLNFSGNMENVISVKVNNRFNEQIAPLSGDFTFFGGLYRPVSLLVVNQVHFNDADYGSDGVFVSTPEVSAEQASLKISGQLINKSTSMQALSMRNYVKDPTGKLVSVNTFPLGNASAGKRTSFSHKLPVILKPQLWSPENPALYTISTVLLNAKTGAILDEVQHKIGFRWFRFDAEKGFFLNGKGYKLMGTSRHQDFKGIGNAVPATLQIKDVKLLKAMGANFLRVAHYPQDQSVLNACDELGILASVEIPVVNEITESVAFTNNCIRMQMEMIRQNYNHPSIVIWAYMNEVLLKTKYKNDQANQDLYMENVRRLALALDKKTRAADPSRYTMIANHNNIELYMKAGLTKIPMIVGWNIYKGWYGGKVSDFSVVLDKLHRQMPGVPFMVTEFGADADPRIHSQKPERFDKSVEYAVNFNQTYLNAILKRPFVAGAQVWNLADFSSEHREETMAHVNNKGLLTYDRKPKNTYYLYRAYLSSKPYLKIGAANKELRSGIARKDKQVAGQMLQVFSNVQKAELIVNGKSLGTKVFKDRLATWNVPFENGLNSIRVVAAGSAVRIEDHTEINFKVISEDLKSMNIPFKSMAISLGDPRHFSDESSNAIWLPDQPYRKGSWGYEGGEAYKMEDHARQPFGTDKNITGTSLNPLYQTQRIGIKAYRLDVPDGKYEITMHFAELVGSEMTTVLPYNLMASYKKAATEDRVFNIYLHDKLIAKHLNLPKSFGPARAVTRKATAVVKNNKGILLKFEAIAGRPVLNALEVVRID